MPMTDQAAGLYDYGFTAGEYANVSKHLAAEAAFEACERAIVAPCGMGHAKEHNLERYLRAFIIPRTPPIIRKMMFNVNPLFIFSTKLCWKGLLDWGILLGDFTSLRHYRLTGITSLVSSPLDSFLYQSTQDRTGISGRK